MHRISFSTDLSALESAPIIFVPAFEINLAEKFEELGLDADNFAELKPLEPFRIAINRTVRYVIKLPNKADGFTYKSLGGAIARTRPKKDSFVDARGFETDQVEMLLVGLLSGGYAFETFKSKPGDNAPIVFRIQVDENILKAAEEIGAKQSAVAKHLILARDLANTPANHLTPSHIAETANQAAVALGIECEIWDEARLEAERCGAIIAVGKGSATPPRLVRLRYGGGPVELALVGKGITFDTGGLSLKPADSMLGMKYDMTGAAVALAGILAIAELGLPVTVEAILCLAENMPGPSATRPGDVITARSGVTIEVTNTDAEGRLVLADGIDVALDQNPSHVVDIATLTGAATIALGSRYAGLMGTGSTPALVEHAAAEASERYWRMPIPEDSRKLLESQIADIMNAKVGSRAGGMLVGAAFLKDFVERRGDRNWAHLDIANVANNEGAAYEEHPSGPTAYGLRTIVKVAELIAERK